MDASKLAGGEAKTGLKELKENVNTKEEKQLQFKKNKQFCFLPESFLLSFLWLYAAAVHGEKMKK